MKPFPYERAPAGSEDKFRLTKLVIFTWKNCPKWIYDEISKRDTSFKCAEGIIFPVLNSPNYELCAQIFKGFCFSVSVAPDFESTHAGSSLHDFFYKHADVIASFYRIPVRTVLHIADHWFLANLQAADFLCARTYFIGVRAFGYGFNRLFKSANKAITQ